MTRYKSSGGIMIFNFNDLNEETRKDMKEELEMDIKNDNIYISPRLTNKELYIKLFKKAIESGNDSSFANELKINDCIRQFEFRQTKSGLKEV
ncbi:MAG: hypothetical protein ACFFG0_24765, partial [Candidatus Thorarchaeota archaeon]